MDLCNSFISQCPQAVFRWKYLNESIFKNKYNMQVYNKMVWLALRIFYDGDIYIYMIYMYICIYMIYTYVLLS